MSDFAKDTNVPTNDLISRQAAIELVDWYQHEFIECDYAFGELSNELSKLPSAQDVVEVVRCKECKYFCKASKYCSEFMTTDEDGFCAWGERSEDVEETD